MFVHGKPLEEANVALLFQGPIEDFWEDASWQQNSAMQQYPEHTVVWTGSYMEELCLKKDIYRLTHDVACLIVGKQQQSGLRIQGQNLITLRDFLFISATQARLGEVFSYMRTSPHLRLPRSWPTDWSVNW